MTLQFASCEDQYKKFPQLDRNEVLKLKKWQEEQPHLPNITELEAIIFLHACNHDIERAKQCLDTNFTVRTHCPEFFSKRNVFGDDIQALMKVSGTTILPGLTKEGYRVIMIKLLDYDASKFAYVTSIKFYNMMVDLWLAKYGAAEGYVFVMDMKGMSLSHMAKVKIAAMRKNLYYVQEALPMQLRASHAINIPTFMDKFMAMVRPFMKKELLDTIHVHSTFESFLDSFAPQSILPNEYGGSAGKFDDLIDEGYRDFEANSKFFIDEEQTKRVDEGLRPIKPKTDADVFGYFLSWFSNMTIKQVD